VAIEIIGQDSVKNSILTQTKAIVPLIASMVALATPVISHYCARTTIPRSGYSLSYRVPYGSGSIPLRFYKVVNPGPAHLQEVALALVIDYPYDPDTSLPQRSDESRSTTDTGTGSAEQADIVQVSYMNVDVIGTNTLKEVKGVSDNSNCNYRICPNKESDLGAGDEFGVVVCGEVSITDMSLSYSQGKGATRTVKLDKDAPLVANVGTTSWLSLSDFLLLSFGVVCLGIVVFNIVQTPKTQLRSVEMPSDLSPAQSVKIVEKATPEDVGRMTLAIFEALQAKDK